MHELGCQYMPVTGTSTQRIPSSSGVSLALCREIGGRTLVMVTPQSKFNNTPTTTVVLIVSYGQDMLVLKYLHHLSSYASTTPVVLLILLLCVVRLVYGSRAPISTAWFSVG